MADNVLITPGSGETIAADDISSVKHQLVKIEFGGDGVATQVSSSDPLPVTTALPTGAATSANQTTAIAHLSEIEGAVETLEAVDFMLGTDFSNVFGSSSLLTTTQADNITNTVDTINVSALGYVFDGTAWDRLRGDSTNGVLVNLGSNNDISGTVTANAGTNLNTSALALETGGNLAAAAASLAILDNIVSGSEAQVDVISMPTTTVQATNLDIRDLTSASDSVAAVQSGTWNVTNVSGTVSLPTGASTSAKQDTIIGHIDGVETLLGTIDADTSSLAGTVAGSELQVDIVSSALPTGASTAANQSTEIGHLSDIEDAVTTLVGFEIPPYDEIDITYVVAGDGAGEIETVVYSLASSTVATLTLSYDASDRLSNIVRS